MEGLKIQKQWYYIRDMFFGWNSIVQNSTEAIQTAAACVHPEAQWFYALLKDCKTKKEIKAALRNAATTNGDGRAYCFLACFFNQPNIDYDWLIKAAEKKIPLAFALLGTKTTMEDQAFYFAQTAAHLGEREGYFRLALCYSLKKPHTAECVEHEKQNLLKAARLNCTYSMSRLVDLLNTDDMERWHWIFKAAKLGNIAHLVWYLWHERDNSMGKNVAFLFGFKFKKYGHLIRKHMKRPVIGLDLEHPKILHILNECDCLYTQQCASARFAIHTFSLCALRMNLYKDMRIFINKMVWAMRWSADY